MLTRLLLVRPSLRLNAKKDDSATPDKKDVHPIKKFLMEKFNIKEIDYDEFKKDNTWAIRPRKKKE